MKDNLWERLLPQAREIILDNQSRYPATTDAIIAVLQDEQYQLWTELPYYIVKMLHQRIFAGGDPFELIDEDEFRTLFESYYEQ